jgi:hypothetical protein
VQKRRVGGKNVRENYTHFLTLEPSNALLGFLFIIFEPPPPPAPPLLPPRLLKRSTFGGVSMTQCLFLACVPLPFLTSINAHIQPTTPLSGVGCRLSGVSSLAQLRRRIVNQRRGYWSQMRITIGLISIAPITVHSLLV